MTLFQKIALTAFIALEVLITAGAVVRATGSGMGCPDWPFCYGCWIPPTKVEQIDFAKLDIARFQRKAARSGRDPATITADTLRAEFNPVATWVEFVNRLTSLPLTLAVLATCAAAIGQWRRGRGAVLAASLVALALLLVNAWLGARVVYSGLRPGVITTHMALAIAMLCVLVFAAWRGTEQPWTLSLQGPAARSARLLGWCLFAAVVIEGVMGSQVREMTDALAKIHAGENRAQWVGELERTLVYLVHRSFSWLVLVLAAVFGVRSRAALGRLSWLERGIIGLVLAQMVLGLVLSQIGIVTSAQILHIVLSSLLVSGLFLWLLAARGARAAGAAR